MTDRLREVAGFPVRKNGPVVTIPSTGLPRAVPIFELPANQPIEWLADRLILRGDINLIAGDGGAYKSTTALQLAGAIATGKSFAEKFETGDPGPVLYLSAEDGHGRIGTRHQALAMGHGWDYELAANVHVLARSGFTLDDEQWCDHLKAEIQRLDAVAVILDPLRDLTSANLNADAETAPLSRYWRALCELPSRPGVVILHHAGKMTADKRTIDRVRGSSALNQCARSILFLERTLHGTRVEHLKCTDAESRRPFVLEAKITEREGFPGMWATARLEYHRPRDADLHEAEGPLLDFIRENSGWNTGALKDAWRDIGVNGPVAVSKGLGALERAGRIEHDPGPHGAKLWRVAG